MKGPNVRGYTRIVQNTAAVLILAVMLFPLYWMAVTSFKSEREVFRSPPTLFPQKLNTASYSAQLSTGDFNMFRSFWNSTLISTGSMLIAVLLGIPAAYGLGRFRFRGKAAVLIAFLVTQMLPVSVLLTPLFILFKTMSILGSAPMLATVLADATIGIPFSVLVLRGYFASIPGEIEDSARIEGCNRLSALIRVFIPVASPGVVVCLVFSFLYGWSDLAYGLTFIRTQSQRPITAGIFNFLGQYGTTWSYLCAFGVVSILPVVVIFVFMQRFIISGMTSGAVTG